MGLVQSIFHLIIWNNQISNVVVSISLCYMKTLNGNCLWLLSGYIWSLLRWTLLTVLFLASVWVAACLTWPEEAQSSWAERHTEVSLHNAFVPIWSKNPKLEGTSQNKILADFLLFFLSFVFLTKTRLESFMFGMFEVVWELLQCLHSHSN